MRSHYCGEMTESYLGQTVDLCGWVHRRRDHGGVIFVDLRDREGMVQIVFQPERDEVFKIAEQLRNEFVIHIKGEVCKRPQGMTNDAMKTGQIEVITHQLTILNEAQTPPFQINETHSTVNEDVRLRHRYMDLRRPEMQQHLILRSQVNQSIRQYLADLGFLEIETPMLTKATPEGARDYLVPSRTHNGDFFALPQSPQLFKQLLMMSGMDKYFQITRCFRDEDLRADRQPEFTQLDLEASFIDEQQIQDWMETMMCQLFSTHLQVELPRPFPRMTYAEAMQKYGSDKPDLRIPLELTDIADLVADAEFKVFAAPAKSDAGRVVAMRVPNACDFSRKDLDAYAKFVSIYGAKGLAYIKVNDRGQGMEGLQSPIIKFLTPEIVDAILDRTQANSGDVIFFGADNADIVNEAMGALRSKLGEDLNLYEGEWAPVWIVDWPMFLPAENGGWDAVHHPFTAPQTEDAQALLDNPGSMLARAYDMVLNGYELGGGSVRIHNKTMQEAAFSILGIEENEAEEKFGFFLDALQYGCPPHAGIAFGMDRIIMLMSGCTSIRDVIAFPKTQTASCLLTSAPSPVSMQQLQELSIVVRKPNKAAGG